MIKDNIFTTVAGWSLVPVGSRFKSRNATQNDYVADVLDMNELVDSKPAPIPVLVLGSRDRKSIDLQLLE